MDPTTLTLLTAVAFGTAALTAAVGLGGGMILLVAMLLYLEPLVAIPVHGVVQLVSNGTRTWIQRSHVRWGIVGPYALPLLPMGYLGLTLARSLTPEHLTLAIGIFALAATWAPDGLIVPRRSTPRSAGWRFLGLGGVVGFLNVTIGATGPLVGPFFRNLGLPRQGVVGSFAACQVLGHLAKIVVFATLGFAFPSYALPIVLMSAGVMAGTWVGSLLLERLDEKTFRRLYRIALTLIALRLVLWDGVRFLRGG